MGRAVHSEDFEPIGIIDGRRRQRAPAQLLGVVGGRPLVPLVGRSGDAAGAGDIVDSEMRAVVHVEVCDRGARPEDAVLDAVGSDRAAIVGKRVGPHEVPPPVLVAHRGAGLVPIPIPHPAASDAVGLVGVDADPKLPRVVTQALD
jgi:hypothetical protein